MIKGDSQVWGLVAGWMGVFGYDKEFEVHVEYFKLFIISKHSYFFLKHDLIT